MIRKPHPTTLLCLALCAVIFLIDIITPRGVADQVLYTVVILVALGSGNKRKITAFAAGCAALTIAGFFLSADSTELVKTLTNRTMALFTIATTSWLGLHYLETENRKRQALEEKNKALTELKVLCGTLPICASCKRIRDGKDSWNQLESYIRAHSEAEFTHGLCPECVNTLYGPEFAAKLTSPP